MIVFKRRGIPPQIKPVPNHLLEGLTGSNDSLAGESSDVVVVRTGPPSCSADVTRIDAVPQSEALIRSPQHQLEVAYTPESISLHHRGLMHGLVRLPRWSGMNNIAPSVYLPHRRGDPIRIVLDLLPQQWYTGSAADERLPAIIERHPLPRLGIERDGLPTRARVTGNAESRDGNAEDIEGVLDQHFSPDAGQLLGPRKGAVMGGSYL